MTDSDPDVRWLSYAEAAKALDVNPESVARRMRRDGWARRRGNDGKPRVAVPVGLLPVRASVPVNVPDKSDNAASSAASVRDMIPDGNPDRAAILALTERAAKAEGEAIALREALSRERERVAGAEEKIHAAERRVEEERLHAATLIEEIRAEREEARIRAARAEAALEELREIPRIRAVRAEAAPDDLREIPRIREVRTEAVPEEIQRPWWRRLTGR
jgi:hypothetical protein